MGNGLSRVIQKLLMERKLTRMRPDRKLVVKEIAAAKLLGRVLAILKIS